MHRGRPSLNKSLIINNSIQYIWTQSQDGSPALEEINI